MNTDGMIYKIGSWVGFTTIGTVSGTWWDSFNNLNNAFWLGFAGALGALLVKIIWMVIKKKLKAKGWI